jgi:UDP-N-acetylglucosamine transferase subunit ALG13
MIFVTVGTNEAPFDRLLHAIERLGGDEEIVVQLGHGGVRPANAECVEFLEYDVLAATMRRARRVVTHAGVGTVLTALSVGVQPIVVPRRRRFAEAVDDHQVAFASRLGDVGLVTLVDDDDLRGLGPALALDQRVVTVEVRAEPALVEELRRFVADAPT